MTEFNPQEAHKKIVAELQKFFKTNNFKKAVIGVSGGIDSAVVLKLIVDAIGEENTTGLMMPEYGVTKDENMSHAKKLCDFFGVQKFTIPINKYLMDLLQLPWQPSKIAQMNVKARLRAILLYNFAQRTWSSNFS